MSNFPNKIDDDVTLPPVNNNLTEIGGEAINALRDAVFNIEEEIGIGASGTAGSIALRLGVTLDPDGYIKPSIINLYGLVTLPIYDGYIAPNAEIKESKLALDHHTQDLYNYIQALAGDINTALGWINATGVKVNPHIAGVAYNHELSHIFVDYDSSKYFTNRFDPVNPPTLPNFGSKFRNNSNAYELLNDLNNDYVIHQKSDGYAYSAIYPVITMGGDSYPSNFAHAASGIHLDTANYNVIPLETDSVQKLADYLDSESIFLLGTRIQNLFTSGISRVSRSSILTVDGYGPPVVPPTQVKAYLLYKGKTSPWDNPNTGDDIIQFFPDKSVTSNYLFDSQFSLVKAGDVLRINYGLVSTEFLVKEKKYIPASGGNDSIYVVRIDGKNLKISDGYDGYYDVYARIDRPLFNPEKYGVLAVSAAQTLDVLGHNKIPGSVPSLVVSHPRGAVALGNGFDPSLLGKDNYKLYLTLYPDGNINNALEMAPIDVTGNAGATPGLYTLDFVVQTINNAFRKTGYNYRFSAFSYQGQLGIMLAEPYNNAAFSIVAGELASDGSKYKKISNVYPQNIITYDDNGNVTSDPLGFGRNKANVASPKYTGSYLSSQSAYTFPTKIFLPLRRNNYYVDGVGVESDKFAIEPYQVEDNYGDGYWKATIVAQNVQPDHVETTYRVNHNLASSGLNTGKTLVVQSLGNANQINFGRFIISSVVFNVCNGPLLDQTDITVYDAVQGNYNTNGISPPNPLPSDFAVPGDGYEYALYFNSDSVGFNSVNSFDTGYNFNYKRHFEVYVNKDAKTFSLERARMNTLGSNVVVGESNVVLYSSAELSKINIVRVSPKLRGYSYGTVSKITLLISNFSKFDNTFTGQLLNKDGASELNFGPVISGRKGEVTRFYDETGIDYIDFVFDISSDVSDMVNQYISIQLFPTVALDDEVLLLASAQLNGRTNIVDHIFDLRQFGNISEKDLSTSALNYISAPERLIHANGVVRGFDATVSLSTGLINLIEGGNALVNGKFVQLNNASVKVPPLQELYGQQLYNMLWALCVNDHNEYQFVSLLDGSSQVGAPNTARQTIACNISNANYLLNPYQIESVFFKDLINSRKDLTPLYIADVDGYYDSVSQNIIYNSITLSDIRKFINDEPLNNTFTWADVSANNNIVAYFHSFNAVKNWINYYGNISNHVIIKGTIKTSGVLDFSQLKLPTIFEGDGALAGFEMSNAPVLNIGANISFKNINFNFLDSVGAAVTQTGQGCSFENCNFAIITNKINFDIQSANNFTHCEISDMYQLSVVSNNKFVDCIFGSITSSSSNTIYVSQNNKFIGCSFSSLQTDTGNIVSAPVGSTADNNLFDSCIFTTITSSRASGFVLENNNKIVNCTFLGDINTYTNIFSFNDYNTFENICFGIAKESMPSSGVEINQTFSGSGYHFLKARKHNLIKNIYAKNIVCSSADASAIRIYGNNNTLDSLFINSIYAENSSIMLHYEIGATETVIATDTQIINSKFNYMESKAGIYLNTVVPNTVNPIALNYLSNILIDNVTLGYSPAINTSLFAAGDNIRAIGGGIYCSEFIGGVTITNCILAQGSALPGAVNSGNCSGQQGNPPNAPYLMPPLICFTVPPYIRIVQKITIENCTFISPSNNFSNCFYAGVAFIVTESASQPVTSSCLFEDIFISNNKIFGYNGFIFAGESGKSFIKAKNVTVSNNALSYISAYSSPETDNGAILIDGNTCEAILSLNYYANDKVVTPNPTGSIIINNNTTQYIDIYVNNPLP